MQTKTKINEVW